MLSAGDICCWCVTSEPPSSTGHLSTVCGFILFFTVPRAQWSYRVGIFSVSQRATPKANPSQHQEHTGLRPGVTLACLVPAAGLVLCVHVQRRPPLCFTCSLRGHERPGFSEPRTEPCCWQVCFSKGKAQTASSAQLSSAASCDSPVD